MHNPALVVLVEVARAIAERKRAEKATRRRRLALVKPTPAVRTGTDG